MGFLRMSKALVLGAVIAVSGVGLAGCGGAPQTVEQLEAELLTMAQEGDIHGEMFVALKQYEPDLYDQFLQVALEESRKMQSARQAGYRAGERMRPRLTAELMERIERASDDHIAQMLTIMLRTYEHFSETDPRECVRNLQGKPPRSADAIPTDLVEAEVSLMIDLISAEPTHRVAVANSRELQNWLAPLAKRDATLARAMQLSQRSSVGKADAQIVCSGFITLYKSMRKRPKAARAKLFRGLAKLSKEQARS